MIRLICTNCQAELSIDDAFAGGVCRCQHCGTIQTVPAAGADQSKTKSLYNRKARSAGDQSASGLDQLADIVASSGLSGSGLTSQRLRKKPPEPAKPAVPRGILIGGGAVIALLIVLVIWLAMRGGGSKDPAEQPGQSGTSSGSQTGGSAPVASGPKLFDIKLNVPSVIYVIDRGNASKDILSGMKDAVLKSVESLGAERKFQVIFWTVDDKEIAIPEAGPVFANTDNIQSCREKMGDVYASGASDPEKALKQAAAQKPGAIVLMTGKGSGFDESFLKMVIDSRGGTDVKIHTVNIGSVAGNSIMQDIAKRTGGEFRDVPSGALR